MARINIEKKVLLVDDQEVSLQIMAKMCTELGLPTDQALNATDALEKIRLNRYAVYVIDLRLPDQDGKSIIQYLNKHRPEAAILVQSSVDEAETIIDIMKLNIFDYIIKPIQKHHFQQLLHKAIEYSSYRLLVYEQEERFRTELARIREIQISNLPKFEAAKGFEIISAVLPVDDLSGDFIDGYPINDTTCCISICDVSGHGMASSYIGVELKGIVRSFSYSSPVPSKTIEKTNESTVNQLYKLNFFATLTTCYINHQDCSVVYASAGHPPAFLYSQRLGSISQLDKTGPLIGLPHNKNYFNRNFMLESGDFLFLYTDGVTEAWHENQMEMFGEDRLRQLLFENAKMGAKDLIHTVLSTILEFTNFAKLDDDLSLICIRKI